MRVPQWSLFALVATIAITMFTGPREIAFLLSGVLAGLNLAWSEKASRGSKNETHS